MMAWYSLYCSYCCWRKDTGSCTERSPRKESPLDMKLLESKVSQRLPTIKLEHSSWAFDYSRLAKSSSRLWFFGAASTAILLYECGRQTIAADRIRIIHT
jgi:hypothetical protein